MASTSTCLYCGEKKPESAFNREHLIPSAFGTFGAATPVLHCQVCTECNQHLGDTVDRNLARDSPEGIERYSTELGKMKKSAIAGKGRLGFQFVGKPFDGAAMELVSTDSGGDHVFRPIPQFRFSTPEDERVAWFSAANLTSEQLKNAGYFPGGGSAVLSLGLHEAEATQLLTRLGFSTNDSKLFAPNISPESSICVSAQAPMDHVHKRGIAKIAFNYFGFYFRETASMPQFDEVREYIRYGNLPLFEVVSVTPNYPEASPQIAP